MPYLASNSNFDWYRLLIKDTETFYRNLGMKNVEVREPPSMVEADLMEVTMERRSTA